MEDDYAIGLDLGTTFSCIGVYKNGGVEIIPNSVGEKITPSIVIFKDNEILVGEDTIDDLVKYYDNCLYEVKRLIGLDFSKKNYQEEIEKLPFKVILPTQRNKQADIEVVINKQKKTFSPTEISSLIIKKMVHNAENYLHKKIKKLVITVPAYFSENQKKLTSQAAEMLNLDVIKIINEPTAAALAYGFTEDQSKDKNILVFDLGGGTFDVSILSFESERDNKENVNSKNLSVLSSSGDMHLGGEDFDNALVDFVIEKQNIDEKKIRKNNQAIKRLKVACENIKKNLSISDKTTLRLNNILDNVDINLEITKQEFENISQPLIKRLEIPLNNAIAEAGKKMQALKKDFKKDDIDEIILVGGSTRIPAVKKFVQNFFPEKKINNKINPDEAVAYGATLQAEKLLYNRDQIISNFHILDIAPFSLGIATQNNSKDKELKKEGDEMSIIIKRGTPLPTYNIKEYVTTEDNQTSVSIEVYEGEKKYVKYNHLLKKSIITGLSKKPKGETKITVEFKIDVNGILYVKAIEKSVTNGQTMELTIKNDDISFTNEEMDKMKKKMEEVSKDLKKTKLTPGMDYSNIKTTLKTYQDAYNNCGENEEEDKQIYLNNFNETLEDFIDKFNKDFDNETLLEKYYLYVNQLFSSYINTLKCQIDKSEQKSIFNKIKKYLLIFIDKSSAYLDNLVKTLSELQKSKKKEFYELIIFIMEKLNELGGKCIKEKKEFSKYHSLMYFEQARSYYEKYLEKVNPALLGGGSLNLLNEQKKTFTKNIQDINSGAIILEKNLQEGRVFDGKEFEGIGSGWTKALNNLNIDPAKKEEELLLILKEYERILSSILIENEPSEKEAKCIVSILSINDLLGKIKKQNKYLFALSDKCEYIIDHCNIDRNTDWYKIFLPIKKKIDNLKTGEENYNTLFVKVRQANPEIFDEIDEKFRKHRGTIKFIEFIITKHPYKGFEQGQKEFDLTKYSTDLVYQLSKKYTPDTYMPGNAKSELDHCIKHEIAAKLSNLIINF